MKQHEDYSVLYWAGGVLTLAVILVLGLVTVFQPSRMYAKTLELKREAVQRGAEVWEQDCATCHGDKGQGVRNSGPALNTKEFLEAAPDELIFNTITDGRPGTSMPAWGQVRGGPYNAQVIEDLVIFIRSWEPTAPSQEELVYEGDAVEGAVLFSTTCFACHGVSGEGTSVGLRLNDPERLVRFSDDYYRDVIRKGRPDRGMPTWGTVLAPTQIEDLVAFIRSWETKAPPPMAALGGDARRGEEIFTSTCVVCHGPAGAGTDVAPRLAEAAVLSEHEALYSAISGGRLEKGMPSWGQVLSPAEINDVIAYLGELRMGETAAPVEKESADAAAAAKAQLLYLQQCASCHGLMGEGKEDKPPLVNNEFIQSRDDAALTAFILKGRPNTAMEGFEGTLSEEEVQLIVQILRGWQ